MLIIETRLQRVGSKNIPGFELAWDQCWAPGYFWGKCRPRWEPEVSLFCRLCSHLCLSCCVCLRGGSSKLSCQTSPLERAQPPQPSMDRQSPATFTPGCWGVFVSGLCEAYLCWECACQRYGTISLEQGLPLPCPVQRLCWVLGCPCHSLSQTSSWPLLWEKGTAGRNRDGHLGRAWVHGAGEQVTKNLSSQLREGKSTYEPRLQVWSTFHHSTEYYLQNTNPRENCFSIITAKALSSKAGPCWEQGLIQLHRS